MGNKINHMYNVFVNTRFFRILSRTRRFLEDSRDFISDTEKSDTEKKEVLIEKETIETLGQDRLDQIYKAYFPNENSLQEFKNALEHEIELLDKNIDYYTYNVNDIDTKS